MLHSAHRNYAETGPDIGHQIERVAQQIELELISWDQIKLSTAARYLVKNIVPSEGLIVVYGPPKCGKTFWVFDLVMHIALGWTYRGRRTHQGTVCYCLFEGQRAFTARAEAFRQKHLAEQTDDVPFYLMPTPLALVKDHPRLIQTIKRRVHQGRPAAVVLDTLNRSFTGSESSDVDMTAYVAAADAVREAFDCAVIIVHHSGLEGGRPRGHTALFGAEAAQIGVSRDPAKNIIATVEFMKDGAEGEIVVSRLEVIEVGIDDDGEPITSCVVVPSDDQPQVGSRKNIRLPESATIALNALKSAVTDHGIAPPASNHIPASAKVVTENLWRRYAYQMGISSSGEDRAKQIAFKRAAEKLKAVSIVSQWGEQCWLAA